MRDVGKALGLDADMIDRLAKRSCTGDDWRDVRANSALRRGAAISTRTSCQRL